MAEEFHYLDVEESGGIVVAGTTLTGVMAGVHREASQSLTGAVGTLDFNGATVKRFTLSGNITGAFTFPPVNTPEIINPDYRLILIVELAQDTTGGRTMDLQALFANANAREGVSAPNLAPGGVTQVLIVARRQGDTITYTANLSPTIDGAQITAGTIPIARIQDATSTQKGVIQIGGGSGGAAAGNHVHPQPDTRSFRIYRQDGGTIVNEASDIFADVSFSGTIIRATKLQLMGDAAATANIAITIDASAVTGASGAVTATASGDMTAIGANTFSERQAIRITISDITGTPKELRGVLHYTRTGLPTS